MGQTCWKCGPRRLPVNSSTLTGGLPPAVDGQGPSSCHFKHPHEGKGDALFESDTPGICDSVSQYQSGMLPPVHRVPPELIYEIFKLAMSTDDEAAPPKPPWTLGHVCRSWRLSTLAYTQFWTSIVIPSAPLRSGDLHMLQAQLLRSSNAPLKVSWVVGDRNGAGKRSTSMDPRMADLVITQCSRWATLRLDVFRSRSPHALDWLRPVHDRLSLLTKLELFSGPTIPVPDVFSTAPNLREVYLADWPFAQLSPDISIPWGQITHYRGAYTEKTQLIILQRSPHLVQCAISLEMHYPHSQHSSISIRLPHLRRLCIQVPAFLDHLTTPLLEDLYYVDGSTAGLLKLLPFVHRSFCTLRKLVLMECDISSELIAVLGGLPSLTDLLIEAECLAKEQALLFNAMTVSGTSNESDLCPNLTSFSYGVARAFPRKLFFAMIQSRKRRGLKRLLVFDPYNNLDTISAVTAASTRMLRSEGIDAVFLGRHNVDLLKAEVFF